MRYCFSRSLVARQLIRRRLGLVLLAALIAFGLSWVSDAAASVSTVNIYNVNGHTATSAQGAADKYCVTVSAAVFLYSVVDTFSNQSSASGSFAAHCYHKHASTGNPVNTGNAGGTWAQGCADGSAVSGGVCPDPAPNCASDTLKNKYIGASVQGTATSLPSTICIQGCAYPAGSVGVQVGTSYATDIGVGTGATCSGANYDSIDTTTKPTDPPSLVSCSKKGMVYGTVNGVGICAAAGTIPNSTVKQQSTSTTQNTDASGVQAAPQTEGTTVVLSNVGGVPKVTETKTNPDGSKTETTEDQGSYCQKNPTAQVCKESEGAASGGADCTAPPSCSGDAIQCMMVNQQWRTRCDSNQPSSLSDLGNQILAGNDPAKNPANVDQRSVSNISSSIDQATFLQGGGGLADKMVTVGGRVIALPFSKLNQYLVWLGHVFVVISLIGGLRIVLGGFKK